MDEYFEYLDILAEDNLDNRRVIKRYIRDNEKPVEFYNTEEFRKRYRFQKDTVVNVVLPLIKEDLQRPDNRGLPIPPLIQLLLCLRFYATCSFQMVAGDLRGQAVVSITVSITIKRVSQLLAEKVVSGPRREILDIISWLIS
ncbi:hypothetical protein NQ318_023232 [Aromia moschata]|uniref:Uncharacterized protein n=1 Tax=Aromia moschata TaxID=1265417 RepID=A0AAV8XN42_9CUCU|nr:hypothetical protein NQ318_023232 [Aromia moschata]